MNTKKRFFEPTFLALQTLHFHFTINRNQYSKGFYFVTLAKIKAILLQNVTKNVTQRYNFVTNRLLQGWWRFSAICNVCNAQYFLSNIFKK